MIELDDESYIVGFWFSSNPLSLDSWLACVIRDPDNPTKYKGFYRFRYKIDDKVFDSSDEKKFVDFTSEGNKTDEDMIQLFDNVQASLEFVYTEKDRIIVKGDLEKLLSLSKDKYWMHIRSEKL